MASAICLKCKKQNSAVIAASVINDDILRRKMKCSICSYEWDTDLHLKAKRQGKLYKYLRLNRHYIPLHRWVWENVNRIKLSKQQHVHHINGNPRDNRPSNLIALYKRDHTKLHRGR